MDMNTDCQLMVLEQGLDMNDLLALTKANTKCTFIVGEVLRRIFTKKLLIFRWQNIVPYSFEYSNVQYSTPKHQYVKESRNYIDVSNVSFILQIVKTFGHLISNLKIQYNSDVNDAEIANVCQMISRYCSESLKYMHIFIEKKLSINYEEPFKHVQHVLLQGKLYHLTHSNLTFSEMFPSMRQLTMNNVGRYDLVLSEQHYPHLEHVQADIRDTTRGQFGSNALTILLTNNQQIRKLSLSFVASRILQMIAKELPNIECLEIEYYIEHDISV